MRRSETRSGDAADRVAPDTDGTQDDEGRRRRRPSRRRGSRPRSKKYDVFISYSQRGDKALAPAVRDGMQRLAKPWNRRRALSVFLDQSSLEVAPSLGDALDDRLDDADWLVLLMSGHSADSTWVGEEIKTWTADPSNLDRMALILTEGTVKWDETARDFDYANSTAINEAMRGVYTGQDSEPLFLDLTWTKELGDDERHLDLDHPKFRDAIATVAAPIHGRSKDELDGDDLRQQKRFIRIRRAAVLSLFALTVAAAIGFVIASIQRSNAIEQSERAASRAIAGDALNTVATETDLSALLALESVRVKNTTDARGGLVSLLSEPTRFLQRTDVHDAPVTAIAISESGLVAATGDDTGVLRVWDVDPDPLVVVQAVPRETPIDIGWQIAEIFIGDDDGDEFLVVADSEGGIWFVDLAAPDDVLEIPPPNAYEIATVDLVGGVVAGVTDDGSVEVHHLPFATDSGEFEEVAYWPEAFDDVNPDDPPVLAFGDDGNVLALADGPVLAVWRLDDDSDPAFSDELATDVTSIAISPDGNVVVAGEDNGLINLYDTADLTLHDVADPPPVNSVFDLAFKPEVVEGGAMTLASAHSNGDVMLWTVLPGEGFLPFALLDDVMLGHRDEALRVAFSPDGRIASSDFEGELIWWNDRPLSSLGVAQAVPEGDPEIEYDDNSGNDGDVLAARFVGDGRFVAVDGRGRVWLGGTDRSALTELDPDRRSAPVTAIDAVAAAPGRFAVGRSDGSLVVLDAGGAIVASVDGAHDGSVEAVALSGDGTELLSAAFDRIVVWDAGTLTERATLVLPAGFEPGAAFLGPDRLWVGGQDAESYPIVLSFDRATGSPLGEQRHSDRRGNFVTSIGLSGDGADLATGSTDRSIKLWDAATLDAREGSFVGHRGSVSGIVFWDDDETLISSDDAGAVAMWDVSERQEFAELGGPTDGVLSLDVDPASQELLAASEDGAIWTWTLSQSRWRAAACELAGRNMTAAEWERYGTDGTRIRHCPDFPIDGDADDATYTDQLTD